MVDVSIVHPTSQSQVRGNITHLAVRRAIDAKKAKYSAMCAASGYEFVPALFDTFGYLSEPAYTLIKDIAAYDDGLTAASERWSHARILATVSCAIQHGNGLIMNTGMQSTRSGAPVRRRGVTGLAPVAGARTFPGTTTVTVVRAPLLLPMLPSAREQRLWLPVHLLSLLLVLPQRRSRPSPSLLMLMLHWLDRQLRCHHLVPKLVVASSSAALDALLVLSFELLLLP